MSFLERQLEQFDYSFPARLIAQEPAQPRDSARLLVYDRRKKKTAYDTFLNLPKYLPPRSVLVLNRTKVIPARLILKKPSGGRVRVLYVGQRDGTIAVLADRQLKTGTVLSLTDQLTFTVLGKEGNRYVLKPSFQLSRLFRVLDQYGHTPLPPYIKHSPLTESRLRKEYQTVFAKAAGSVAAPTASLHFTSRLFSALKKAGHTIEFVTLHVNLGTFATLTQQQLLKGKLHSEYFEIQAPVAKKLEQYKKSKRPIIAVGTTVVRTLESACPGQSGGASDTKRRLKKISGETDIFIRPGYKFKFVDGLITNFHVPRSSLLMLVSALMGRQKILKLYKKAIQKKFRLFSFGDGMLVT